MVNDLHLYSALLRPEVPKAIRTTFSHSPTLLLGSYWTKKGSNQQPTDCRTNSFNRHHHCAYNRLDEIVIWSIIVSSLWQKIFWNLKHHTGVYGQPSDHARCPVSMATNQGLYAHVRQLEISNNSAVYYRQVSLLWSHLFHKPGWSDATVACTSPTSQACPTCTAIIFSL